MRKAKFTDFIPMQEELRTVKATNAELRAEVEKLTQMNEHLRHSRDRLHIECSGQIAKAEAAERAAVKVKPRLTDAMIRAACKAHFGSDNSEGINVTAHDVDWSFRDAFKRMWHGAWSAFSPAESEP